MIACNAESREAWRHIVRCRRAKQLQLPGVRSADTWATMAVQDGGKPAQVAGEVESALLKWGGGVTAKYRARFRTISFNLKDAANPDLRRRLLSREIPPDVRP